MQILLYPHLTKIRAPRPLALPLESRRRWRLLRSHCRQIPARPVSRELSVRRILLQLRLRLLRAQLESGVIPPHLWPHAPHRRALVQASRQSDLRIPLMTLLPPVPLL